MIGESYKTLSTHANTVFQFESVGIQGTIKKVVVFQQMGENKHNLAFGDMKSNDFDDEVISNNLDFVKVMNTVAKTVYEFTERYSDAIIHIEAVDERRLKFYNAIFKRHFKIIDKDFSVFGLPDGEENFEKYNPEDFYSQFELKRK